MARLIINGEPRSFDPLPATIRALVAELGLREEVLVAELDGTIVRGREFATTTLQDGSRIELVQLVGGG